MRRAAAILCLLLAIMCGVFWVRSYSWSENARRLILGYDVEIVSGNGAVSYQSSSFPEIPGLGSGAQFSDWTVNSEPIDLEVWPNPGVFDIRFAVSVGGEVFLSVPWWMPTCGFLAVAILIAFPPPVRRLWRRNPPDGEATAPEPES